ncbi:MAG: transcriptional repressor LexA [bacterium]|nr:transcriptional repressor LexA [bacterium]
MPELSKRQREILDFIQENQQRSGYPPTLREICKRFAIASTNGARYHLHRLQKMGYLEVAPNTSRGMRLVGSRPPAKATRSFQLPILGRVPAGPFNLASPDLREDELTVDPEYFGARGAEPDLFGLRVNGDSMVEAGIHDGDIVVVRPQEDAHNGDIVVARLEEEATVKRFRRGLNEIVLEPANRAYKPIHIGDEGGLDYGQNFALLGVVVGLIRSM